MTITQTTEDHTAVLFYRACWAYMDLADAMRECVRSGRQQYVQASSQALEAYAKDTGMGFEQAMREVMSACNPANVTV